MMTSAAVLLAAVLVLGGLLAVLGDRLGTKVGKARLRLFGLRPRQTATVVTILTGILIAASTLGILFALSKSLRQGVFQLDEILKQKRIAEGDLESARSQKTQVEQELAQVNEDKKQVEQGLIQIQQSFNEINKQVGTLRAEILSLRSERQQILQDKESLARQRDALLQRLPELQVLIRDQERELNQLLSRIRTQERELNELLSRIQNQEEELAGRDRTIQERERQILAQDRILRDREQRLQELQEQRQVLQAELSQRDSEIAERDEAIAQLDEAISQRDLTLRGQETQLAQLAQQRDFLEKQVKILAQDYQGLRQGNLAIARGQVLGFGVVRILEPAAARGAIEQILREANRNAISATRSNSGEVNERVVQITQSQVEDLIDRIDDGQDYVVRILSAGNYVEQEKNILVVADVALNREIFKEEETIATVSLEMTQPTQSQIENRLDLLLAASQFRARRSGLLGELQVGEGPKTTLGQIATLTQFIEQIVRAQQPIDRLQAIATETTYTAGPLKLKLVAMQKGEVIFSTQAL
ncbi:MAG: DUF3084 domain-containing protein [Cyanobacteriota bacterium]|nr:DUF3084 domain-containing protein [Cyanobacteriota bacterium]